jgi:hypothetical protein
MSSVLSIPNTNASVVTGPDGSGHGFAIGLTCPVQVADTAYTNGGATNGAYIGSGVTDMTVRPSTVDMNQYAHSSSVGRYKPFVGGPFDGGGAAYGDRSVLSWCPNFSLGTEDRPLGVLLPVCLDNGEYNPSTPLQGFAGPSALMLGGSECLANAHVITLNPSNGNQAITGIGFQPDFLYFLGCCAFAVNDGRDGTNFMVGAAGYAADGTTLTQWVGCTRSEFFSGAGNKETRWQNDACIAHIGQVEYAGATTVDQKAEIVSMDADGYTINMLASGLDSSSVAHKTIVLAVKVLSGAGISVGSGVQGDTTIPVGFQPDAMLFASSQNTSLGTDQAKAYFSLGAMDVNAEINCWAGSDDGLPLAGGYVSTVSSIRLATTSGGVIAEANCTFPGAGTDVDLTWTTDDSSARHFGWVAFQVDSVLSVLPGCSIFRPQIYRRP